MGRSTRDSRKPLTAAIRRRAAWLAVVSVTILVAVGGAAYASVPDAAGVIHGCYSKTSGSVRIIDSSTQACSTTENGLNWNQIGPTGPQGPQGLKGETGA